MPRSAGTYTLPANSLAVSGTTISSTYFNAALNDIASEMTASVPRDGTGAMSAGLQGYSGSAAAPSFIFSADATTGWYRKAAGQIGIASAGTLVGYFDATGWVGPVAATTLNGGAGICIDRAYAEYATNADLSAAIPLDDTIPQIGEGTQVLTVSLTPKSATNRVRVRFQAFTGSAVGAANSIAALFIAGAADASQSVWSTIAGAGYAVPLVLEYEHVPGVTTSVSYAIRVSGSRLNGTTATRYFGGSAKATLVVEEITA